MLAHAQLTRSVVSVAPRLLHIAPYALLWWAKVVRGRVSVCSLVIPCQLMPLIRQLSALFRLRISKLAPHGGQLSDTICEPGLVWRKSCFGGTVICTSGHHSALLHPSPSVRVTLADRQLGMRLSGLQWLECLLSFVFGCCGWE